MNYILPHSYHLTCLKLLRPLRRAGLDLLVVGTTCGQWRPFWGKGTDQWTHLTLQRKKTLRIFCTYVCEHAYEQSCVHTCDTHTYQAACLYVQISLPVSASHPWYPESSGGPFLHPLWPVNHCCHSTVPEFVKLYSYQCKSFFFWNIWSLYTRCAVPCLSNDRAQEVSRDQAMVLLFLYCDRDWYSVTIG